MHINADLARLGNLFKLAMTELSDETTGDVARKLLADAHHAMQEARGLQDKLRQKIMKIIG